MRKAAPPNLRKGVLCGIIGALILSCNHYCRDSPGTIEEQLALDPNLAVSPRRYALLTAVYFTPSTFVPLVLGMASSAFGVSAELIFLGCAWMGVLGNAIAWAGAAGGSFALLLSGRGVAGAVYEAIDMMPLGFLPGLLPQGVWPTLSGLFNCVLRLGSVAAFVTIPAIYESGGGDDGGGTRSVFLAVALVGSLMGPLATAVWYLASGRADECFDGSRKEPVDAAMPGATQIEDDSLSVDSDSQERGREQPKDSRAALVSALKSVPRAFWIYTAAGTAMYASIIPFWFYGSGFLQRSRGFTLEAADRLMVFPEGAICVLSVPTGTLVGYFKMDAIAQQRALGVAAFCIALSHVLLAAGASASLAVVALGSSYAVSNQLFWSAFPHVCPPDIHALGAGILACLINCGATAVPLIIGLMHEFMPRDIADVSMILILGLFALTGSAIAISRSRKELEGYQTLDGMGPMEDMVTNAHQCRSSE